MVDRLIDCRLLISHPLPNLSQPILSLSIHTIHSTNPQIPDAKLLTDVGTEITFQLPFSGSGLFVGLFEYLDANSEQLGVRSYGMGVTSMEEVFIKVAEGTKTQATAAAGKTSLTEKKVQEVAARRLSQEGGGVNANGSINKDGDLEAGVGLMPQALPLSQSAAPDFDKIDHKHVMQYFFRHMAAMLRKRALYFIRQPQPQTPHPPAHPPSHTPSHLPPHHNMFSHPLINTTTTLHRAYAFA